LILVLYTDGIRDETTARQFDHNVFAPLRLTRSILPYLRSQKEGTVVNPSSLGGMHSFPGNGIYCSTKFALEAITFALAEEIAPFGLKAMVVQPGYFRTGFLDGVVMAEGMKEYEGEGSVVAEARRTMGAYNGRQLGNPSVGGVRMVSFPFYFVGWCKLWESSF